MRDCHRSGDKEVRAGRKTFGRIFKNLKIGNGSVCCPFPRKNEAHFSLIKTANWEIKRQSEGVLKPPSVFSLIVIIIISQATSQYQRRRLEWKIRLRCREDGFKISLLHLELDPPFSHFGIKSSNRSRPKFQAVTQKNLCRFPYFR